MENKITLEHLQRKAVIYIRQSTTAQVITKTESQHLQYGLLDRAQKLGWPKSNIHIIDEDLGHSAGGTIRSGFDQLLADVSANKVGAILSIDASSRLARNGREWHTLLEFCGIVNTLLIDPGMVYDLNLSNDRLLLGFKGEFSVMELRTSQERSQAAIKSKAQRGELYVMISAGYVKGPNASLIKDPDQRIQKAIALVFEKFQQIGSIRQTQRWFVENNVEIPVAKHQEGERKIIWKIASWNTFSNILNNPVYAGTYVYGRTKSIVEIKDGRKHIRKGVRQSKKNWGVYIPDHHEGYISRLEFESNQEKIAQNTNRKRPIVRGSSTGSGDALLSGLLRCGHCGAKLITRYQGNSGRIINYQCPGRDTQQGRKTCINFGGGRVDQAVSNNLLEIISDDGLKAAEQAIELLCNNQSQVQRQRLLALEQAQYEAQRAKRQYNSVDPENRLVAATLESNWNEALKKVSDLENEISQWESQIKLLSENDRREILSLANDLPFVWFHPKSSPAIKKSIVRTLIKEIMVNIVNSTIELKIHWYGGDHSQVKVKKNNRGETNKIIDKEVRNIIVVLARMMPDKEIACFLNRRSTRTATGLTWTSQRVCSFRKDYQIPVYTVGEREARNEMTVYEVSTELNITVSQVRRFLKQGIIPAEQVCKGAPWIIKQQVLQSASVIQAVSGGTNRPLTSSTKQKCLNLQ
ncbi:MAG: recombinase family protein [Pseudomonadales bacterium]